MKQKIILFIHTMTLILALSHIVGAQSEDSTGLAGDHFSLEAALEAFKKAENPESFEKKLNQQKNQIHNLDIDGNDEIDYIHVNEYAEDEARIFVLSVNISEDESQDIAIIELEKNGDDSAMIQIIGDEEIFGETIIIEPSDEDDDQSVDDMGGGPNVRKNHRAIVVNVWAWPSVRYVYRPGYRPWVSPYRYNVYPSWWRPWRPLKWSVWAPIRLRYYTPAYRVTSSHRVVKAHKVYTPLRRQSKVVSARYAGPRKEYNVKKTTRTVQGPRGNTVTKSKTKVQGPRGNSATKTTTKVKGENGKLKAKKTKVNKSRKGG